MGQSAVLLEQILQLTGVWERRQLQSENVTRAVELVRTRKLLKVKVKVQVQIADSSHAAAGESGTGTGTSPGTHQSTKKIHGTSWATGRIRGKYKQLQSWEGHYMDEVSSVVLEQFMASNSDLLLRFGYTAMMKTALGKVKKEEEKEEEEEAGK
jgi:hypothetical protein